MHLADAFFVVTALIYVAATAVFGRFLVRPSEDRNVARKGAWLLGMGMALHSAHISIAAFALHICPVQGVHFALNVASLVVVLGYLVMRTRVRIDALGAIVAPFALTFLLGSRSASSHAESPLALRSALLPFHVAANVLGIALFTLASVAAAAYLVQEHLLKSKRLDHWFRRLPPLDALDRAEHGFLLAGFPLLTVGILIGTLWAHGVETGDPTSVARAIFGYASWILFATVLILRAALGWRGRRAAWGTIVGYGFTLAVIVVYLLRQTSANPASGVHG